MKRQRRRHASVLPSGNAPSPVERASELSDCCSRASALTSRPMPATDPIAAVDLVIQAPDIGTPQIKHLARLIGADAIDALSAAQTQAFRLSPARERGGVAEFCADAGIDFGFVPAAQRLQQVRLVAMDMDSTLI